MRLRSTVDGTYASASLQAGADSAGENKLILAVQRAGRPPMLVGPVTAALGYELADSTPAERAVLRLIGYHLRRLHAAGPPLQALAGVLLAQGLGALRRGGAGPEQARTWVLHPRAAVARPRKGKPLRSRRTNLHAGQRRRLHGAAAT